MAQRKLNGRVPKAKKYLRLGRDRRRRQILETAVRYFSTHGFDRGTRALAEHMEISQSLLYHYFSSKEELIEEVYRHLFERRWDSDWEQIFKNSGLPPRERIAQFYIAYFKTVLTKEWTRIFVLAALRDLDLHKRNHDAVRERIFPFIVDAIAGERRRAGVGELDDAECETAWNLHSAIFYIAIREWVFKFESRMSMEALIRNAIDVFIDGAPAVLARPRPDERHLSA
ncbi:MAG: TetR/AcrR family transcriptional regulator [Solimonas sp.]